MRFNMVAWAILLSFQSIPGKAEVGDIIGICETHYYDVTGGDTPEGKPVKDKLNSIILHKTDFEKEDIADAIKFLSNKSKELDPTHVGVQIRLKIAGEPQSKYLPVHREVTIRLDDTSLAEILAYVCEQTGLGYRIIGNVVIMRPA